MKNSPLISALLAAVAASALASLVLCYMSIASARELRTLQAEAMQVQAKLNVVQRLSAEAVEYSKSNPAINPILEAAGLKPKTTPASSAKPPAH